MKSLRVLLGAMLFVFFSMAYGMSPELKSGQEVFIVNAEHDPRATSHFPKNWRTFQSQFHLDRKTKLSGQTPSLLGLEQLLVSGSGQFPESGLKTILGEVDKVKGKDVPVFVIDLRQESHGFLNGSAVSWYGKDDALNSGKSLSQILEDEKGRFKKLAKGRTVSIKKWSQVAKGTKVKEKALSIVVQLAETEDQLVERLFPAKKVTYFRLPSPDHKRPSDKEVDEFLTFYLTQVQVQKGQSPSPSPSGGPQVPARPWLHFHCAAGQGRTTSYLAMVDMIENAKRVSAQDILTRQWLLGGKDLRDFDGTRAHKKKWAIDRLEFLYQFYEFCRESQPEFKKSWSDWVKEKKARKPVPVPTREKAKDKNGAEEVLNLNWRSTLPLGRPPEVKADAKLTQD